MAMWRDLYLSLANAEPGMQVGVLFVTLFGLLGVAAVATLRVGLRDDLSPLGRARLAQWRRDLNAAWLGAVVFWVAWISKPWGAALLFAVISFLALREFITLTPTRRSDHRTLALAFFVVLPAQYLLAAGQYFDLFSVFIPVYVFAALPIVSVLAGDAQQFLARNARIQWGVMVCVFGLSHAPALLVLDLPSFGGRGAFLVFFLVATTLAGHVGYVVASQRPQRRPRGEGPPARGIDKRFSYAALGLGTGLAALVGVLLGWITPFGWLQAGLMAALAGATGIVGALIMQALKIEAGVRVWGNQPALTGAVGLLDRIAPLAFSAPLFFHTANGYFRPVG